MQESSHVQVSLGKFFEIYFRQRAGVPGIYGGLIVMAKHMRANFRSLLVLAAILFVPPCLSQEHAPTAEQCRADQALWGSDYAETKYHEAETRHVQDGTPNRTDIALLSIPQLRQRMEEMYQCSDVVAMEPYHLTGNFYYDVIADRYSSFLRRHGLVRQMMKEDADGKR
jgi:hypothetical protein